MREKEEEEKRLRRKEEEADGDGPPVLVSAPLTLKVEVGKQHQIISLVLGEYSMGNS